MTTNAPSQSRFQDVAYILHGRAYQNSSMIVDVFTRLHGRLSLIAKGAKRPTSALYGVLQPMQCLYVSWGGRSDLKTLYAAEIEPGVLPRPAGEQIYIGMYLNELLIRLLHREEAHAQIFDYYQHCLQLMLHGADAQIILRYFELQLLEELGYAVNLDCDCDSGQAILPGKNYAYIPERGFIENDLSGHDEMRVHGETIMALASRTLSDKQQIYEAKLLLRGIIEYHLDGQPLKTRELFTQKIRHQSPE